MTGEGVWCVRVVGVYRVFTRVEGLADADVVLELIVHRVIRRWVQYDALALPNGWPVNLVPQRRTVGQRGAAP